MHGNVLRKTLPALALALGLLALGSRLAAGGAKDEAGFKPLFNGKSLDGWKVELGSKSNDETDTFTVKNGTIHVSGKPNGYFYTDKSYKNYVLRFDWKFLKNGNSGTLVHIQPPQRVWPKSIEVQGMQTDHGRIFAIGGASGKFTVDKQAQKKAIKIGEWNTTEIVSRDGMLISKVNGIEVSKGKGSLEEGPFGFQSEGAPMLYKNIRIKVLD